jgi:hypothetical protein
MWFSRPQPTQRQPHEDAVEWARKETWAFTVRKCRIYGARVCMIAVPIALISKGMPLHFLWRWLGIPLLLAFACVFTPLLYFSGIALGELLDRPRKSK